MTLDQHWFSEIDSSNGSAFSLKIKNKLHEEQTPFQKIAVYATEAFGHLMVIDGYTMLSQRENFLYHEMLSHPALFSHRNPQKVLIIGGGDCGTLQQVLQHTCVESAVQVDIDERVTRLAEQYFPELCSNNHDPRVQLLFDDGIAYVKDTAADAFDIIIVDSTDPVGPAEGLFNQAFHRECFRVLRDGGLLVQQSESPLYHRLPIIEPLQNNLRQAGFQDIQRCHFPQPLYPSGWWSATLAGKNTAVQFMREQEARNKTFRTHYYNADIHKASLAIPEFMRHPPEPLPT